MLSRILEIFVTYFGHLFLCGFYLLSFLDLFYHIECWTKPHLDSTHKPLYTAALVTWVVVALFDLLLALLLVGAAKKKDFAVPDLVRCVTFHFTFCPCVGKEIRNTYGIQILAVWHVLAALQIASFHSVFVFIGFIAQPLHTALTIIFYVAIVFCLATTLMLLYATCHIDHYITVKKMRLKDIFFKISKGIGQLSIFIFFLSTIIFFGFTFLRITVFVGDTESGRIPGLVGSLLPSVLIAILGYMAKKLLDSYSAGNNSDDSVNEEVLLENQNEPEIDGNGGLEMSNNWLLLKRASSFP